MLNTKIVPIIPKGLTSVVLSGCISGLYLSHSTQSMGWELVVIGDTEHAHDVRSYMNKARARGGSTCAV